MGATVIGSNTLGRVWKYTERVKGKIRRESHLTVLPPFIATYEEASDINLGCMSTSVLSTHPINAAIFEMRGLDLMEFNGEEFLHFPITVHMTGPETWEAYVLRTRQRLVDSGISFASEIPKEHRPHINIFAGKYLSKDQSIAALISESQNEPALYFNADYLTLYAKYKNGWRILSHDPALE